MNKLTRIIVISIFLFVYVSTNYYICNKLMLWIKSIDSTIASTPFVILYSLFVLTLVLSFFPLPRIVKKIANPIGSYWMGVYIYLLVFFVVIDIILFILRLTTILSTPASNSVQFYAGLLVILLTLSFVSYGIFNARRINHVTYNIKVKETKSTTPIKIVLISDLHLGAVHSEDRLQIIVNEINKMNPDIVCIAGDIFNDNFYAIHNPDRAINLFKSITATYGVYGSLGNHDGGTTFNLMLNFLEKSNIKLLHDNYVIIDERLVLIGRLDPSPIGGYGQWKRKDVYHIFKIVKPQMPIVVMDHTPSHIEQYGEEVDLILAGHTHKGQIFPGNLITNLIFEVDYGYYQKDSNSPHVIVSSGTGTWGMPMRVGSNNEIVTINLK